MRSSAGQGHAWVERHVGEVGEQVDHDHDEREHEGDELDDRVVARRDRSDEERPDPRQPEDLLDDDRAADEPPDDPPGVRPTSNGLLVVP